MLNVIIPFGGRSSKRKSPHKQRAERSSRFYVETPKDLKITKRLSHIHTTYPVTAKF